jgi:hypothetical protein
MSIRRFDSAMSLFGARAAQKRGRPDRPGSTPRSLVAGLCLAALASAGFAPAAGAQALDTSRLPRAPGAIEVYASPPTTIYTAPDPVAAAAAAAAKALAADGWRQYSPPNADQAANAQVQAMTFKKGSQGLSALVTLTPQAKTANVNYTALVFAHDLPFPADATGVAFDPSAPYLSCASAQPLDALLDFFGKALGAAGWTPAPKPPGAKPPTDGKAAHAYFTHADEAPLLLVLQRGDDGKTSVELKSVPAEVLLAELHPAQPAPAGETQPAATPPKAEAPESAADETADSIVKQAQQMAADAVADASKKPVAPAPTAQADAAPLEALAGNPASIPVPQTAEQVEFDGAQGSLEFDIAASVKAVAAFYRTAMKPLGWSEQPSVINRPNMVELDFSKAGKTVSLTILQMGAKATVSGSGEGLVTAAAEPAPDSAPASPVALEAEESEGFPVPSSRTSIENEQTPFRHGLNANVSADLNAVLAFYRRELTKRGWSEQAGADVKTDHATLAFTAPQGPAVLKLISKDGETAISLVVRDPTTAAKAGMAPKPGQVKVMLGNATGAEAVFTINKQTLKVVAGAGIEGKSGPTIELPPGKYKVAVKLAGQPAMTEEEQFGGDETWGLMAGPGGVLPVRMY